MRPHSGRRHRRRSEERSLAANRLADMLNIPLKTVENVDSSLGSAMLAGVAVGVFREPRGRGRARCVREQGVTLPDPEGVDVLQRALSSSTRRFRRLWPPSITNSKEKPCES